MTPGQRAGGNGGVGWVDPASDAPAAPKARGLADAEIEVERTAPPIERDLTFDEIATWGDCEVCHAKHGEWCHADVGAQLGVRVDGRRMKDGEGAHLARLRAAPKRVRLVPA